MVYASKSPVQGLQEFDLPPCLYTPCHKVSCVSYSDYSNECCVQDLADKIAQLNSAIDDVSSQLKASDAVEEVTTA